MTKDYKIYKIPFDLFRKNNHPIVPKNANSSDVTYAEAGTESSFIVFQMPQDSIAVFEGCDDNYDRTIYRPDPKVSGSFDTVHDHIASNVFQSARELCRNYINSKKK